MNLGIMQPYFFPHLGYFDLINRTDRWVVFDVVKYNPKSWMNRNRILHPTNGWQYITVPIDKHRGDGMIKDVLIVDKSATRNRVLGQIEHYRVGRAPYFAPVRAIIDTAFSSITTDRLRDLNVAALRFVCEYVGIPFNFAIFSEMRVELPTIEYAGAWALEISTALGASAYFNPPGGRDLFRKEEFEERGIDLRFTELLDFRYNTAKYGFVDRLSIIDVLMWNPPQVVKHHLDELTEQGITFNSRGDSVVP
jgi:hypothetical protein